MKFFRLSLMLSTSLLIFGALFKVMHWPGANIALGIALICALVFILIGLWRIYKSENSAGEKILWLVGFIVFPWIAGFIYYFVEVKPKLGY